jgi:hypothetical protein
MPLSPSQIVEWFPAVGLAELEADAALLDRVDTKYVIPAAAFAMLADRLRGTHVALEIDGRRAFAYHSTYFDTPELGSFRDHLQQRRRRYKCRSRGYLDSGTCVFEVKLKGARGRTVKYRMAHDGHRLSAPALAFLRDCLEQAYGRPPDGALGPVLAVAYTRVTLAAPALGERLTCDFDLRYSTPGGGAGGALDDGMVIVESKSPRGNAVADLALRALGHRSEPGCSKYCLGVGLTRAVTSNPFRPLLRRHFRAIAMP